MVVVEGILEVVGQAVNPATTSSMQPGAQSPEYSDI